MRGLVIRSKLRTVNNGRWRPLTAFLKPLSADETVSFAADEPVFDLDLESFPDLEDDEEWFQVHAVHDDEWFPDQHIPTEQFGEDWPDLLPTSNDESVVPTFPTEDDGASEEQTFALFNEHLRDRQHNDGLAVHGSQPSSPLSTSIPMATPNFSTGCDAASGNVIQMDDNLQSENQGNPHNNPFFSEASHNESPGELLSNPFFSEASHSVNAFLSEAAHSENEGDTDIGLPDINQRPTSDEHFTQFMPFGPDYFA